MEWQANIRQIRDALSVHSLPRGHQLTWQLIKFLTGILTSHPRHHRQISQTHWAEVTKYSPPQNKTDWDDRNLWPQSNILQTPSEISRDWFFTLANDWSDNFGFSETRRKDYQVKQETRPPGLHTTLTDERGPTILKYCHTHASDFEWDIDGGKWHPCCY